MNLIDQQGLAHVLGRPQRQRTGNESNACEAECRQHETFTETHTDKQIVRQIDRQTERDRQTDSSTDNTRKYCKSANLQQAAILIIVNVIVHAKITSGSPISVGLPNLVKIS